MRDSKMNQILWNNWLLERGSALLPARDRLQESFFGHGGWILPTFFYFVSFGTWTSFHSLITSKRTWADHTSPLFNNTTRASKLSCSVIGFRFLGTAERCSK